ncbi:hypothetical protein [Methanobrevibacter sp. V74]|uniref:hypothetical protein n=1 Tax=Methanobrevibacter sp. V74 TaxID=3064279 RepID=UPI00273575F8|nr:hypothetical protein [Methanobrevibacter sp. V74]
MLNPDDLKYEYVKHLPAVTIKMLKSFSQVSQVPSMENENQILKSELDNFKSQVADFACSSVPSDFYQDLIHLKIK